MWYDINIHLRSTTEPQLSSTDSLIEIEMEGNDESSEIRDDLQGLVPTREDISSQVQYVSKNLQRYVLKALLDHSAGMTGGFYFCNTLTTI